jgi:hypothetical protein
MDRHTLSRQCAGKRAKVPAFRFNDRNVRFHPRTVLAKLAADAGVSPEVIAASLNKTHEHDNEGPRNATRSPACQASER